MTPHASQEALQLQELCLVCCSTLIQLSSSGIPTPGLIRVSRGAGAGKYPWGWQGSELREPGRVERFGCGMAEALPPPEPHGEPVRKWLSGRC